MEQNQSKAILLVEDNPDDATMTRRALKKATIVNPVVTVRDGQEALDYLFGASQNAGRNPTDLPEVVLLDLNLPKVDGIEVLRRIRADKQTQNLPVIILTSSEHDKDWINCKVEGINSFITKPVNFTEFAEALKPLGLGWKLIKV